jgi:putative solute:sodium symporter small subunit
MEKKQSYWSENLRLIFICLAIWFVVSFGFGLLLVEPLNEIRLSAIGLGGYKLGFWFAQQGSIYTFVALVFWYTKKMNDLDKKYNVEES